MKILLIIFSLIFNTLFVFAEERVRSYSDTEDQKIIQNALKAEYGDRVTNIEFKTLYNPIFQLGNATMKLQPILKKIGGSYIRENEIVYRVQYSLDKKSMDCLAMISDVKNTKKLKVNIGTCNQSMKDIVNWKDEFTRFEDVPSQPNNNKPKQLNPANK